MLGKRLHSLPSKLAGAVFVEDAHLQKVETFSDLGVENAHLREVETFSDRETSSINLSNHK